MPATIRNILILLLVFLITASGIWIYRFKHREPDPYFHGSSDILIVVDPGHVASETGVVGRTGVEEKELTLILSLKLVSLLQQDGFSTMLTRVNNRELSAPPAGEEYADFDPGLSRRVALANNNDADIFVSIHVNSFPDPQIGGAQVFYHASSLKGKSLAASIQREMDKSLVNPGRKIMAENFFVLRMTKMPSVLVEVGFLTNPAEEKLLLDENYQDKVVAAIYDGIINYFTDLKTSQGDDSDPPKK